MQLMMAMQQMMMMNMMQQALCFAVCNDIFSFKLKLARVG